MTQVQSLLLIHIVKAPNPELGFQPYLAGNEPRLGWAFFVWFHDPLFVSDVSYSSPLITSSTQNGDLPRLVTPQGQRVCIAMDKPYRVNTMYSPGIPCHTILETNPLILRSQIISLFGGACLKCADMCLIVSNSLTFTNFHGRLIIKGYGTTSAIYFCLEQQLQSFRWTVS